MKLESWKTNLWILRKKWIHWNQVNKYLHSLLCGPQSCWDVGHSSPRWLPGEKKSSSYNHKATICVSMNIKVEGLSLFDFHQFFVRWNFLTRGTLFWFWSCRFSKGCPNWPSRHFIRPLSMLGDHCLTFKTPKPQNPKTPWRYDRYLPFGR